MPQFVIDLPTYAAPKRISNPYPTFDLCVVEDDIHMEWGTNEKSAARFMTLPTRPHAMIAFLTGAN